MIARLLFRYGSQTALILAPMITAGWSLLNWLGHTNAGPQDPVSVNLFWSNVALFAGPKQEVELRLRLLLSGLALLGTMAFEAFDLYLPIVGLREFRREYLSTLQPEWQEKLGHDVRINVMYARRPWYLAFCCRVFRWTWNYGFDPPDRHHDANLWLTQWQGVCGQALRAGVPKAFFVDAPLPELPWYKRWFLFNAFHLTGGQLKKTRGLKAVLSIPIYQKSKGDSATYRAVGVINLDAMTEEGAQRLRTNQKELTEYFVAKGKILASLRL